MALERAVVATSVGGNPESVEDGLTGLLVPPGSPARLSEAILRLCADPDARLRMGALARMRAEEHFSICTQMRKLDQLYRLVLARRRAGGRAGRPLPADDTR